MPSATQVRKSKTVIANIGERKRYRVIQMRFVSGKKLKNKAVSG